MRKWVSLCSVSAEGSQKGGIEGKEGEGEKMYWCKTHPPAEKLKHQPSRVGPKRGGGTLSKYCHALLQPSKSKTSELQHSAPHAPLSTP